MASTLVRFPELAEQVASLVFFGTKRGVSVQNPERWLKVDLIWNRLAPWLARRNGFLAARSLKIGADDEPLRYLQETIPWVKCGPWQDPSDGFAYDEAAARVNWPPLWMISAKADKVLGHRPTCTASAPRWARPRAIPASAGTTATGSITTTSTC